ncbi:MAG: dTDP-glucose 4,6-dehydratase [Candidatus Sungbacteria bacterium]|uniref:dTDP-glucose 4,6-dehydratase n=1 Tax=Candidatus Sungiibacteriota bacterium TaxID=2750080 RepID=A0A932VQZ4_9BACT|nr:dTDP-glucose 4,6-dehydratase [Candidatus Sungbacteria bacterium]
MNPKHKTLLVTGGAGFIGSAFVRQAIAAGQCVIVLDALTYAGHRINLEGVDCTLVVGDIADGALVAGLLKQHNIDAVAHFAAESHVDNSISKPSAFIDTNIVGTYRLLEAAREYWNALDAKKKETFRYLQVSTDEVYGSLGPTGAFSETTAMKPNSPYSASKAAGDHLARAWHKTYGLPVLVTNCSNNYGPRQHPEKLIPHMITCALSGKPLPVYGDGKNVRDWIHVEDHCAGVALALEKGAVGETYCFGGQAEEANLNLVNQLCAILDELRPRSGGGSYASQITFVTDRLGHDRRYAIDDTKARSKLGFTRRHNFASGLRATVEWYLNNGEWCRIRKAA